MYRRFESLHLDFFLEGGVYIKCTPLWDVACLKKFSLDNGSPWQKALLAAFYAYGMSFYEKYISQIINDLFVVFGPDKVKIFSFFWYFLISAAILVRTGLINLFLNIFFEIPVKFPLI